MPWGRLDDSLYDHPKVEALPDDLRNSAVGLWARAVSWCNRYLTDGRIPRTRLVKLDGSREVIAALLEVGFLETIPAAIDVFQIHDFLDFNDAKVDVEARRERNRQNAKGGRRPAQNGDSPSRSRSDSPSEPRDDSPSDPPSDRPRQSPSERPSETPTDSPSQSSRARAPATRPVPSPSRPVTVPSDSPSEKVSAAVPARAAAPTLSGNGVTLTPAQMTEWRTFDDPAWAPFREAWLGRGFRRPPRGSDTDEPGAAAQSPRAMLWEIADARPRDLARWTREAPAGLPPNQVVAHVLAEWHALRARNADEAAPAADAQPSRTEAATSLGAIVDGLRGRVNGKAADDLEAFGK